MKTPDEIKKGLECCHSTDMCECVKCPYSVAGEETMNCDFIMSEDALAYIQQLERERDALMVLVKEYRPCWDCIHRGKVLVEPCLHCDKDHNHFEWRGVKEDE